MAMFRPSRHLEKKRFVLEFVWACFRSVHLLDMLRECGFVPVSTHGCMFVCFVVYVHRCSQGHTHVCHSKLIKRVSISCVVGSGLLNGVKVYHCDK